jgi:hypothetical protein
LAVCALARPAGAGVSLDLDVSDQIDGKYGSKVEVEKGDKVYFRMTDTSGYNVPVVCVCEIPMLKWKGQELLLPGQTGSMSFAATCPNEGTFKLTACMTFVDPKTGRVHEVDDSVTIEVEPADDEDPGLIPDPGSLPDGTGKTGGQQQTGGQQGGGQQQTGQQQTGGQQQGGQQQGGQQQGGVGGSQQQGLLGNVFSFLGLGGGGNGHGGGKKNEGGGKGSDKKGKGG